MKVFLSYARKDGSEHVRKLHAALIACGHAPWFDSSLDPSRAFSTVLEDQIDAAESVVLCLTEGVRLSEWVANEVNWALLTNKPIYVARCQPDVRPLFALNRLTPIDCYDSHFDSGVDKLCSWLKGTAPPPPALSEPSDPFGDYLKRGLQSIVEGLRQRLITPEPLKLTLDTAPEAVAAPPPPPPDPFKQAFSPITRPDIPVPTPIPDKPFTDFASAAAHFNHRVLLLGAPGAGKTITLMDYARQAFYNRLQDPTQPLPLFGLVPLWDAEKQPALADWLAESNDLDVDRVRAEIEAGRALILLDGLDELGGERENEKTKEHYDPRVRLLEALWKINTVNRIILTCRDEDYAELHVQAALAGALRLQPLAWEQIQTYLADQSQLLKLIETDKDLRELAQTPLLLSILGFNYVGLTPAEREDLNDLTDARDLRDRIFLDYVRQRYRHEAGKPGAVMPFEENTFLDLLGRVALEKAAGRVATNVLGKDDFEWAASGQAEVLMVLGQKLRVLAVGETGTLRFVHLLLRDALVYWAALGSIRNDPDADVRRQAAWVLGEIADPRAVEALITALRSDLRGRVRGSAAQALGEVADSRAVDPLIVALTDLTVLVRSSAAYSLGKLADLRAVEPLITALRSDPDALVRLRAAGALGRINTPEARAALEAWQKEQKRK